MRSMIDMDTIQIEVTNLCRNSCSNCTRFSGHKKPYFMSFEQYKQAVDSMVDYPKMTGMQGGEPLLHPDFQKMCEYLRSKIPYEKCGLWTTLPEGYEHYREDICSTFKHIFINDHTRIDIMHHPPLVSVEEMYPDKHMMWAAIDHCWAQESWSASIYPSGAWFCEIAGSMSMLFEDEGRKGWEVEPNWWWRIPSQFWEQMNYFCPRCGFPCKINRRSSMDGIDDISPKNFERLKKIGSRKILSNKYEIYSFDKTTEEKSTAKLAAYKDTDYRNSIAQRYGIFLYINDDRFWTPVLLKNWDGKRGADCYDKRKIGEIVREYYPE